MGKVSGKDLQQGRFLILGRDSSLRWDLRTHFSVVQGGLEGAAWWEDEWESLLEPFSEFTGYMIIGVTYLRNDGMFMLGIVLINLLWLY